MAEFIIAGIKVRSEQRTKENITITTEGNDKDSATLLNLLSGGLSARKFEADAEFMSAQTLNINTSRPEMGNPTLDDVNKLLTYMQAQYVTIDDANKHSEEIAAQKRILFARAEQKNDAAREEQPKTDHALAQARRDMKPYAEAAAQSFKESTHVVLNSEGEEKLLNDLAAAHLKQKQKAG